MVKSAIRRCFSLLGYDLKKKSIHRQNCWADAASMLSHITTPIVVDVGANIGTSCGDILAQMPLATVFCMEPDPATYSRLIENVGALPNVHTEQIALGARQGELTLHQNKSPDTNSLLKPSSKVQQENWKELMDCKSQTLVKVTTLESWCAGQGINQVHLLKTDCQGYDLEVLKGGMSLLNQGRIHLLICEVLLTPLYEQQAHFEDILHFARLSGYKLHGLYDINYDSAGNIAWADALFVHPSPLP